MHHWANLPCASNPWPRSPPATLPSVPSNEVPARRPRNASANLSYPTSGQYPSPTLMTDSARSLLLLHHAAVVLCLRCHLHTVVCPRVIAMLPRCAPQVLSVQAVIPTAVCLASPPTFSVVQLTVAHMCWHTRQPASLRPRQMPALPKPATHVSSP